MAIHENNIADISCVAIDGYVPSFTNLWNVVGAKYGRWDTAVPESRDEWFFGVFQRMVSEEVSQHMHEQSAPSASVDLFYLKPQSRVVFPTEYLPIQRIARTNGDWDPDYAIVLGVAQNDIGKVVGARIQRTLTSLGFRIRVDGTYAESTCLDHFIKDLLEDVGTVYAAPSRILQGRLTALGCSCVVGDA